MTKAKLCSNKLCKSAFQKYLAKNKKKNKNKRNKKSIKVVTVHNITERNASGQHLLQPDSNLRLINNTLRQHQ